MDIKIDWFRSYQFDGNIYVKCPTLKGKSAAIKYALFVADEFIDDPAQAAIHPIREQTTTGNKQICFEGLEAANYTVQAQTIAMNGQPTHTAVVTIRIPESALNRKLASTLAALPAFSEKLKQDPELGKHLQQPELHKKADHTLSSVPPTLDDTHKNILYVMFKPGGHDRLIAQHNAATPETNSLKNLQLEAVFDSRSLSNKKGKLRQLAPLINLYRLKSEASASDLLQIAQDLEALEYVKYCSIAMDTRNLPPPELEVEVNKSADSRSVDKDAATPDFSQQQNYLDDEGGMDVYQAWSIYSETGKSATVRHLDFGVYRDHEDLRGNITVVSSRPETEPCHHGTASTGCIAAIDNGLGVTGIAHGCDFYFYDTGDTERVVADMEVGDILSFDIQITKGEVYLPQIDAQIIWDLYHHAVNAGAVVIFAGGNGGNDLGNTAAFHDWGNSGATLIGSVYSATGRRKTTSNYNLHQALNSWGEHVTTIGYSDLQDLEGHNRDYTATYNGTSSATPLVSGALALIQSYAISKYHLCFTSQEMHLLVQGWGNWDAIGQQIGHRPLVANTLAAMDLVLFDNEAEDGNTPPSAAGRN